MRTLNLKFIGAVLFAVTFLIGGFFIHTQKADAASTLQSFHYSLSPITSYANSDGGTSTIMRVGCLPGSGDIYDINSGKLCSYITSVLKVGCALGSGDKYDVNTGSICLYGISNTRIGCAVGSVDKYDINNGKLCTNKTKPVIIVRSTPTISANPNSGTSTPIAQGPVDATSITNPILSEELTETLIEEEIIDNNLVASSGRINSIFDKPISIWAILLLVAIILGVGYNIYYFTKKDPSLLPMFEDKKDKKNEATKPIVQNTTQSKTLNSSTPLSMAQPKGQENHANIPPQSKIPDTPLTHTQVNTPNPQKPLNIPDNSIHQGDTTQK